MIVNFPRPFLDESLYSLLARYTWMLPLRSWRSVGQQFFASEHATATVDLPSRLGSLTAQMTEGQRISPLLIIKSHTALPFYAHFLPPDRVAGLQHDLVGTHGNATHVRAGIMASKVRPHSHLLYCPTCAEEERAGTGEAYWHRLFQLPGVFVCPKHCSFLEASHVDRLVRSNRHAYIPAQEAIPHQEARLLQLAKTEDRILLHIAKDCQWLLGNDSPGHDLDDLHQRYIRRALQLGYATGTGRIHWDRLLADFRQQYSEDLLGKLSCSIPSGNIDHWLARLLRTTPAAQAPLRHLILLDFFGLTAEQLLKPVSGSPLFGDGPWACENPACPNRGQKTIHDVRIEHSHEYRAPIGIFACPVCGWTECRRIVDGQERTWIRDFGPRWHSILNTLWATPTVSLRSMARQLQVDPMTAKRYAAADGLHFPRAGKRLTGKNGPPKVGSTQSGIAADVNARRMEWTGLRQKFPNSSTTELRSHSPACHAFLHRHDREWLRLNCPPRRKSRAQPPRVNWAGRDSRLADGVDIARQILLSKCELPRRISRAALGRQLGALSWIQKHPAKLPLTIKKLTTAVESREAFLARLNSAK
jgi:hypothetical protein